MPLALKTLRHRNGDISRRQIYGLEPLEFDALVLASQGRCMICDRRDEGDALTGLVIERCIACAEAQEIRDALASGDAPGPVDEGDEEPTS